MIFDFLRFFSKFLKRCNITRIKFKNGHFWYKTVNGRKLSFRNYIMTCRNGSGSHEIINTNTSGRNT